MHCVYRFLSCVTSSLGNDDAAHNAMIVTQMKIKYAKYPPRYPLSIDSEKSEFDTAEPMVRTTLFPTYM